MLVPTANMTGFDEVPHRLVPARACENRVMLAYANACGVEGPLSYGGLSTVADPSGAVLRQAHRGKDLFTVGLSRTSLEQARRHDPLADRRPDLYQPLSLRPGITSR